MTLFEIINIFKDIALSTPNIRSASEGSVYDKLNTNNSIEYDVFHITQTTHTEDFETDYYGLTFFYISRLEDSLEDNRLQIQSIGKEVLGNIIRTFCDNFSIDFPDITYIPFTQRFTDLCAGIYCNIRIEIPKELICPDNYLAEVMPASNIKLQDIGITITQNGLRVVTPDAEYDGIGEIRIDVQVPQTTAEMQDKEVTYTENGVYTVHPDRDYDGMTSVQVEVDVPDMYEEGYEAGERAGEENQKAKLVSTSFTENNTYTREDGYSAVTVNVPDRYDEGYTEGKEDGIDEQKAKLSALTVTINGEYRREDGYSAITVNVPQGQGYEEGYEDGEAAQKAKLTSTSFTENNTYTIQDGWSAVTVNVPQSEDRYEEGFEDGMAAQKALLVSTAFTENGTYRREDGYSVVVVSVEQTGYTQEDLDNAYDRGYADGLEACHSQPITATSITLNVASTIRDNGTATTTVNPSGSTTNLSYTSSDRNKATIDSAGNITVKATGSVQFCVRDSISELQDCKTVNVIKTNPITAFTYTADTSTIPYSGDSRTITYSTSGFNSSSIGFICPDGANYRKSGTTITVIFPYNYYSIGQTYTAKLAGYTSDNRYIETPIVFTQEENPITYGFTVIYNVTSTTSPTKIMQYGNCYECGSIPTYDVFVSATASDGTVIPLTGDTGNGVTFTFPRTGEWSVNFSAKGEVLTKAAFYGCDSIVKVRNMSHNIKIIEGQVFQNCTNLQSIILPSSLEKIRGKRTFANCTSLTAVTFSSQLEELPSECFSGCSALNVRVMTMPTGLKEIGWRCFANCKYSGRLLIPETVIYLANGVFSGCSGLTAIQFQKTNDAPSIQDDSLGSSDYTFPIYVPASAYATYMSRFPSVYRERITAL